MSNLTGSEEIKIRGLSKTEKTILQSLAYSDNRKSLNQYLLELIKSKVSENELQNYHPFFEEMLDFQKHQLEKLDTLIILKNEMLALLQEHNQKFSDLLLKSLEND